ncbi:MAG TPA: hypothetical protein V6D08_20770, partial [Candidatus Obscuribacterales bacterium]
MTSRVWSADLPCGAETIAGRQQARPRKMKVFYEIHPGLLEKSAIALGFFDGVHLGHQAVIDAAIADARKMAISSVMVTFKEHPRTLTTGKSPLLLTVLEQRLAQAEQLGINATIVLEFTEQICRLT